MISLEFFKKIQVLDDLFEEIVVRGRNREDIEDEIGEVEGDRIGISDLIDDGIEQSFSHLLI